jgi:hypothetical protein
LRIIGPPGFTIHLPFTHRLPPTHTIFLHDGSV